MGQCGNLCSKFQGSSNGAVGDIEIGTSYGSNVDGMYFPMWVLPVSEFLKMSGAPRSHQELVQEKKLVKWQHGMFVSFISHNWLGKNHPDPNGEQLEILRRAMKKIISGALPVKTTPDVEIAFQFWKKMKPKTVAAMTNGYIWFDWFGVPQITAPVKVDLHDVAAAVESIPAYVEASILFFVICPSGTNRSTGEPCNFSSWRSRGWCRLEATCRALSRTENSGEIITVFSENSVRYENAGLWLYHPVGEGKFTVESDREALADVVRGMVESKLAFYKSQGRKGLFHYRLFTALTPQLFKGLPGTQAPSDEEDTFLSRYHFKTLTDAGEKGFSPLMCASIEGNPTMIERILEAGGDVLGRTSKALPEFCLFDGISALTLAAAFGCPKTVAALIQGKADVNQRDGMGQIPLNMAAAAHKVTNANALLEAGSNVHNLGNILETQVHCSVIFSNGEALPVMKLLLDHKADPNAVDVFGGCPLHWVSLFSGNADEAKLLIEYGARVNEIQIPRTMTGALIEQTSATAFKLGFDWGTFRHFYETRNATPLHIAAMYGHSELVCALLDMKADGQLKNFRGHTALELAKEYRQFELLESDGVLVRQESP